MDYKDYYEVMGVAREASQDELKPAHRKLARKGQPEVSKDARGADESTQGAGAYGVLKDPDERKAHDELGNQWQSGDDFRPPRDWGQQRHGFHGGDFSDADASRFSDFFESLFGGQGRAARGGTGFQAR